MAFKQEVVRIFLVFLCPILLLSCASGPQPGSPETGYVISGFVGESATVAAPSVTVALLNVPLSLNLLKGPELVKGQWDKQQFSSEKPWCACQAPMGPLQKCRRHYKCSLTC
jgi:hypothetical protein